MGFYAEQVVPRLVNAACGTRVTDDVRRRACAGLHGEVVEIGSGSGLNVPFYPSNVRRVLAVEPSDVAWQLSQRRRATVPVLRAGRDAQAMPLPDASVDCALSTWTLCTIPEPRIALGELRRVLKPGGAFHFVEHGLAPDANVQRWQRRLEPVQKRLAGGCHLTRPITHLLTAAGFSITDLDVFYEPRAPKVLAALSLGRAVSL